MSAIKYLLLFVFSFQVGAVPREGQRLMISAASPEAVAVGEKIGLAGGNVVDVAVAVGMVMAVTSPYFAALGGGGFAMLKMGKDVEVLDFREIAPKATDPSHFLKLEKTASTVGGHAVAVPGMLAGWWSLHKKYGKLKWSRIVDEAIRIANSGFRVGGEWVRKTTDSKENFNAAGMKYLFKADKSPLKAGDQLRQPQLAHALRLIRDKGDKGFYQGPVAKDIVASVKQSGGVMSTQDLAEYRVRWLKPLTTDFAGYKLYLMPPPSSGGVVIQQALRLITDLRVLEKPALSADEFHFLGEIQSRAFRGRSLLGDPDFHKNPLTYLSSDAYMTQMRKSISARQTAELKPLDEKTLTESTETTHFSVMDNQGHAVAITITLNGNYGSGVVSNRYGIALNNEMDDFTTRPGEPNMFGLVQGQGNVVEAGKRPLSSMSPALASLDDKVVMSLGAPGGPRIISSVLQVLYRTLGRKMDLDMAIQAPRVHHQFLPNILYVDAHRFSPEILEDLKRRGHKIEDGWMARVYAVRLRDDGILEAAYDARGEGAVGGY
ncbi:MAG: gamma-glutamyltransferase [Bdellovibrionales bacterium]